MVICLYQLAADWLQPFLRFWMVSQGDTQGSPWYHRGIHKVHHGITGGYTRFTMVSQWDTQGSPRYHRGIHKVHRGITGRYTRFTMVSQGDTQGLPWYQRGIHEVHHGITEGYTRFTMVSQGDTQCSPWYHRGIHKVLHDITGGYTRFNMVSQWDTQGSSWYHRGIHKVHHGEPCVSPCDSWPVTPSEFSTRSGAKQLVQLPRFLSHPLRHGFSLPVFQWGLYWRWSKAIHAATLANTRHWHTVVEMLGERRRGGPILYQLWVNASFCRDEKQTTVVYSSFEN